ncbi:MAG: Hsp20/alpha crystallin family protein [Vicinamibacterales bacterium]|nr:Hsp20/alpha crystallin family protein [Vicinamibacterales bacterium]
MFRRPDPSDWMWGQACELIAQAERLQRQFFRLASSGRAQTWEPPVDVFEDERELVIVVAMPGVAAGRVEIRTEPGVLVVRGERVLPFAATVQVVRHLEIPYGFFERRIPLPGAQFELGAPQLTDGCLTLRLRKRTWPANE